MSEIGVRGLVMQWEGFNNDRETKRFRGIAFVEMEDAAAAAKAIAELDGAEFFGRQMVVKEARPPKF